MRARSAGACGVKLSRAEGHLGRLRAPFAAGFVGPAAVLFGLLVILVSK